MAMPPSGFAPVELGSVKVARAVMVELPITYFQMVPSSSEPPLSVVPKRSPLPSEMTPPSGLAPVVNSVKSARSVIVWLVALYSQMFPKLGPSTSPKAEPKTFPEEST